VEDEKGRGDPNQGGKQEKRYTGSRSSKRDADVKLSTVPGRDECDVKTVGPGGRTWWPRKLMDCKKQGEGSLWGVFIY